VEVEVGEKHDISTRHQRDLKDGVGGSDSFPFPFSFFFPFLFFPLLSPFLDI